MGQWVYTKPNLVVIIIHIMFSLNNKILLLDILQYLLVVISYLRARGLYNYTYGVCGNAPVCSPCEVVQIVEVQWEAIRWRSIQSSRVESVISLEDGATGGQLAQLHASKEEDIFPHCQWTVEKQ